MGDAFFEFIISISYHTHILGTQQSNSTDILGTQHTHMTQQRSDGDILLTQQSDYGISEHGHIDSNGNDYKLDRDSGQAVS